MARSWADRNHGAALAAASIFHRRYPLACFGFLVFVILLAPTSSIIPIKDPIAERRVYLPMIGLLLILLEGIGRLRIGKTAMNTVPGSRSGDCRRADLPAQRRLERRDSALGGRSEKVSAKARRALPTGHGLLR